MQSSSLRIKPSIVFYSFFFLSRQRKYPPQWNFSIICSAMTRMAEHFPFVSPNATMKFELALPPLAPKWAWKIKLLFLSSRDKIK